MAVLKLTSEAVNKIPLTENGQLHFRDTEMKGFGVRIGTSSKVYYAEAKVNGRTVRHSIGHHLTLTAEEARREARKALERMAGGVNLNDEAKAQRARSVSLGDAFDAFLEARKNLKARTIYDYKRFLGRHTKDGIPRKKNPRKAPTYFEDWVGKPIAEITKGMVERRHAEIGKKSEAQANLAMRFLRALFNFFIAKYEDSQGRPLIGDNPVKRLSQTRAWFRVERRKTVIKPHEIKPWLKAVQKLKVETSNSKADVVRDWLVVLLLTGLRRQEASRLTWDNVDFRARTLTVTDTKHNEDHTLPLSDYLHDLLKRRKAQAQKAAKAQGAKASNYVFPGEGQGGYLVEPKKQMEKVSDASGVAFTPHDLRRTFTTVAESLDIPAYALKRLINHKQKSDVTAGYIVADVERLREPMQKITDYMLKAAGVKPGAEVIKWERKEKRA